MQNNHYPSFALGVFILGCCLTPTLGSSRGDPSDASQPHPPLWKDHHNLLDATPRKFGLELEYLFPDAMANMDYKDRLKVAKEQIDKEMMKVESLSLSPRFQSVIVDDYFVAHKTGVISQEHLERWRIVPDASLVGPADGFELVSPVMTSKRDLLEELMTLLPVALEQKVQARLSETTDFHVHVDVSTASMDEIRSIYQTFLFFETALDAIQTPNHQGNENPYAQSNLLSFGEDSDLEEVFGNLDECTTVKCLFDTAQPFPNDGKVKQQRYYGLHYSVKGSVDNAIKTMEFRGRHGSLDPVDVYLWVNLCVGLVENAIQDIDMAHSLLRMVYEESVDPEQPHYGSLSQLFSFVFSEDEWYPGHILEYYQTKQQQLAEEALMEGSTSIYTKPIRGLKKFIDPCPQRDFFEELICLLTRILEELFARIFG